MLHPPHILVVDDDERLRNLLYRYLREQGWMVTAARHAADARRKLEMFLVDLIVLDVMMPGESGVELAQSLRKSSRVPILMLTAMGEVEHRIAGLEAGADDYLGKPFEPRELVLRIRSILQRTVEPKPTGKILHFGDFAFDMEKNQLSRQGEPVYLTGSEIKMLSLLAGEAGAAVTRSELASALPGDSHERSVDVQINRLRKKIEPDPGRPVFIQTVRGQGYMLCVT